MVGKVNLNIDMSYIIHPNGTITLFESLVKPDGLLERLKYYWNHELKHIPIKVKGDIYVKRHLITPNLFVEGNVYIDNHGFLTLNQHLICENLISF